jgi:glycosyltransferase involved in cell wall biosynthesis
MIKRLTGAKFLFDMRGFWADERVDGGLWPRDGRMYRIAKACERRFLLSADHVVSLSHAGVREMQEFDYLQARMPAMTVIPTCADLSRFKPGGSARPTECFTLGYVGSAGTWYLFDATVTAFKQLQGLRPGARFLIVNRNEHRLIREKLQAGGIDPSAVELTSAQPNEIPALMARMDATAFFIKPVFSKQASAPTKLAEFLGCGIPCLTNAGVGDMAPILREERVGVAAETLDASALRQGVIDLLALCEEVDISGRCVDTAFRRFSLESGVGSYAAIYRSLEQPCAS